MTDIAEALSVPALDEVIIRFAGDSGDGMQLTGDRFTSASAMFGNDLATLPEYPAEIRAPAGTLAGVSAFQVHISDHDITTPGDAPDVLVAMNPAALRSDLHTLVPGGTLIVNKDTFEERNLAKAVKAKDEAAAALKRAQDSGGGAESVAEAEAEWRTAVDAWQRVRDGEEPAEDTADETPDADEDTPAEDTADTPTSDEEE